MRGAGSHSAETVGNAWRLADRGDASGALKLLADAPSDARSQWLRGVLASRQGDFEAARDAMQAAVARAKEAGDTATELDGLLGLAAVAALDEAPTAALQYATTAAAAAPEDGVARHLVTTLGNRGATAPLRGEVASLFDDYAVFYQHHLTVTLGYRGHVLVVEALTRWLDGRRAGLVVDIGCGTGLCGDGAREVAETVVGVDLSAEMVEACAERPAYAAVWQEDAVYALRTLAPSSVSAVLAADVVGYIRDVEALFSEVARVLTPDDGVAVLSVEAWDGAEDAALGPSRRLRFSARYLQRAAEDAGLRLVERRDDVLRHEGGEAVAGLTLALARA